MHSIPFHTSTQFNLSRTPWRLTWNQTIIASTISVAHWFSTNKPTNRPACGHLIISSQHENFLGAYCLCDNCCDRENAHWSLWQFTVQRAIWVKLVGMCIYDMQDSHFLWHQIWWQQLEYLAVYGRTSMGKSWLLDYYRFGFLPMLFLSRTETWLLKSRLAAARGATKNQEKKSKREQTC